MISLAFLFLFSLLVTLYVMPHSIRKLTENNYVAKDMYKLNKPQIPTNAGIVLIFTSFIAISLFPLFIKIWNFQGYFPIEMVDFNETNLALLLVISIYALYGLVDDLVDVGRILKLILPITFSFSLITVINIDFFTLPFYGTYNLNASIYGSLEWEDLFRIIIIPVYVMVVANLVNMHSGYNGLQSGLSVILIATLIIKSLIDNDTSNIWPVSAILGSLVAFLWYNKYPAKVFEGNIGSLFFGSTIGVIIVIQKYWWFGFFILLPHTFNLLLWICWLYLMRSNPRLYLDSTGSHQKFGRIRSDNSISVPNFFTLKWIPNYFFNLSEKQSTNIQYIITTIFCLIGLII